MKEKTFSITTPIYYVNAKPHLGHTYTTIVCDTLSRYHRVKGAKVFFLTGTDEHGDKIVKAAEAAGKTAQEYADEISGLFRFAWEELHITNDDFIRTTEERHKRVVGQVLTKLHEKGDIYLSSYTGKYCFGCERYLTDKELDEQGHCPDHKKPPELIEESNYFFRMQKYLPVWKEMLAKNPEIIYPERYYNEVMGVIDELIKGGEDLSISRPRSRLTWGIELPFDKEYVTYVWFDALLNYVSAMGYPDGPVYGEFWPATHMIAKDILKPHAVYWPTMLLAAEIPLYSKLLVHGYWLGWGDVKMSKSLGNALDPHDLKKNLGEDALRFFLMREMSFGQDARFSEDVLARRLNSDLANDLGNLVQRTLSMLKKYFGGTSGDIPLHAIETDLTVLSRQKGKEFHEAMEHYQIHKAIEAIFEIVRFLNGAIETHKPWAMAKTNSDELAPFLQSLLKGIVFALEYLQIVLVSKAPELLDAIDAKTEGSFPESVADIAIQKKEITNWPMLFARIETSAEASV